MDAQEQPENWGPLGGQGWVKSSLEGPLGWWQLLPVSCGCCPWQLPVSFLISASQENVAVPNRGWGGDQQDCSRIRDSQRLFQLVLPAPGQGLYLLGPQFPCRLNGPETPPLLTQSVLAVALWGDIDWRGFPYFLLLRGSPSSLWAPRV